VDEVYGDEPLLEWIYEAEDKLVYRDEKGKDATKVLLQEDLLDIAERHKERVFDQRLEEIHQARLDERAKTIRELDKKYNQLCEEKVNQSLLSQKEEIVKKLIEIEKEKWNDAYHCTCLGYAIVQVFGEKHEEELLKIHQSKT